MKLIRKEEAQPSVKLSMFEENLFSVSSPQMFIQLTGLPVMPVNRSSTVLNILLKTVARLYLRIFPAR